MSIYIEAKVPKQVRNQIRLSYKFRGNSVTLNEEQPAYIGDGWTEMPVAQFRYEESKWKIYWQDSKRKWHFVDDFAPKMILKNSWKSLITIVEGCSGVNTVS